MENYCSNLQKGLFFLQDDVRQKVRLNTFGFFKDGNMSVEMTSLTPKGLDFKHFEGAAVSLVLTPLLSFREQLLFNQAWTFGCIFIAILYSLLLSHYFHTTIPMSSLQNVSKQFRVSCSIIKLT